MPDTAAKKVISAYNPTATATYNTNLRNVGKCNSAQLEECAKLLGFTVRNETDEKLYRNLKILADRIILEIESLFKTKCIDCNTDY